MSLHDEKPAALAEVLAATGEEIVWKGRTLRALVSDNPLSHNLGLGGFKAKGDAILSFVNDRNADAEAFFYQANARGIFWST